MITIILLILHRTIYLDTLNIVKCTIIGVVAACFRTLFDNQKIRDAFREPKNPRHHDRTKPITGRQQPQFQIRRSQHTRQTETRITTTSNANNNNYSNSRSSNNKLNYNNNYLTGIRVHNSSSLNSTGLGVVNDFRSKLFRGDPIELELT